MKKNITRICFIITLLFTGLFLQSCKTAKPPLEGISLSEKHSLILLDSTGASTAILQDKIDGFFENITPLDMMIQLKKGYSDDTPREEILADYKTLLQEDVTNFTQKEEAFIRQTFEEAFKLCNKLSPNIFPPKIELIKVKGLHYGPSVYYTREDRIVIPANELENENPGGFLSVMLHEIFHVYSRYHPAIRDELYSLIGFNPIDAQKELDIHPELARRILLNPDGVNWRYAIDLKQADGKMIQAVPIIASAKKEFDPAQPRFFGYVDFQLYQLNNKDGGYQIFTDKGGKSTLDLKKQPDFFRQIKDNTNYIIHPDEIMADNFKYLVMGQKEGERFRLSRFSTPGQQLLDKVKAVMTK